MRVNEHSSTFSTQPEGKRSFAQRSRLMGCLLIAISTHSHALPQDQDQPIEIQAQTAELSEQAGVATYKGNVKLIQGSLQITAAVLTLYGTEEVERVVATGSSSQLAHYQQQIKENADLVHAYAEQIDYYPPKEQILLQRQAKLEQQQQSFSGNEIRYNIKQQKVDAAGTVNIIIPPRKKSTVNTTEP